MNESLRSKIEQRAYELFVKRGGKHGHAEEDWAKAEKEILSEQSGKKPAAPVKPSVEAAPQAAPIAKQTAPVKKPQPGRKR
jgi:hypothetical protein